MLFLKEFEMLSDLLYPASEKISKENSQQISKNNQIISTYCIEVFAWKMTMNQRSTTRGLTMSWVAKDPLV